MKLKLELFSFICTIFFIYRSSCFKPELTELTNSGHLLANEGTTFNFINNSLNQVQKFVSENEKSKSSSNSKDFQYIIQFECFINNICFYINKDIHFFSYHSNYIEKINLFSKKHREKNIVIPFNNSLNKSNLFQYITIYMNKDDNFEFNFYKYNRFLKFNELLFKNKIEIFEEKENIIEHKENYLSCNLILNSIICFYSKGKDKEISIKKFYMDIKNKKFLFLKDIKPKNNISINGIIKNSFMNKENSKILLFYDSQYNYDNKILYKIAVYNIIENNFDFDKEINDINDINSNINMNYYKSINKFVLYTLNRRKEILIIELNENFNVISRRNFKISVKFPYTLINYHLINYNRNYQIILFLKNNNNKQNIIISRLEEITKNITTIRNLQENGGNNPGQNGDQGQGDIGGNNGNEGQKGNQNGGEEQLQSNNNQHNENPNDGENQGGSDIEEQSNGENPIGGGNQKGGMNDRRGETKGGFFFDFDNKNTTIPRGEIRDNRGSIMSLVQPGEKYELKGDDYSIKVAPMGRRDEGSTSIDFMDCEKKLREYYNLSSNSTLSVFQTETTSSNNRSLTNRVSYVVYDENNTQLNLSVCENQKVRINYAIKDDSNFNMTRFSQFEDKGIDILNSSDPFFNDICYTYSEGSSDMILSDRINEIYQNYSLCDSGCEYEGLNSSSGTVSCSCDVDSSDSDSDDDNDSENLKQIFLSLFSDSTFGVVKCYNRVFSTSKSKNIGFWVFLVITISNIPLYIWFFMKGNSQIKDYINGEMEKYHYISNPIDNNINNPPRKKQKKSKVKNAISKKNNLNENIVEIGENKKGDFNTIIPSENDNHFQKNIIKISINQPSTKRTVKQNLITSYKTEETLNEGNNKLKKVPELKSTYSLIQLDANNSLTNEKPIESNYILNNYDYETAIKYESRTFWRILYIVMISKDNVLNTFILKSPLKSKPLQICLLIFSYSSDLALNTLFYFSDNISDKYHYTGNYLFWYTLFNNILISIISTVLSLILGGILNLMAQSKNKIEEEFKKEEKKLREDPKYKVSEERKIEIVDKINKHLKILQFKMTVFVIIDFIIMLFFFYFVTAFCEVYSNTQTSWISDAIVSIIISFPIELAVALVITIIYFLSIKYKWKCLYKLVMIFV